MSEKHCIARFFPYAEMIRKEVKGVKLLLQTLQFALLINIIAPQYKNFTSGIFKQGIKEL